MPLPTPGGPGTYGNQTPLQSFGRTVMTRTPDVSMIYNLLNSAYHLGTGTLGQWGRSPSIAGRITAAFSGNPTNAPRAIPVGPMGPPSPAGTPAAPYAQPQPINAYPGSFGNFGTLPGERSVGPPIAGRDPNTGQPIYNARGTIAPPPTPFQQGLTAVGNYAQGTVNSYGGGSDLQQLSLLRQLGLDNTPTNNGLFGSYAAPWNLAQASGATSGGELTPPSVSEARVPVSWFTKRKTLCQT